MKSLTVLKLNIGTHSVSLDKKKEKRPLRPRSISSKRLLSESRPKPQICSLLSRIKRFSQFSKPLKSDLLEVSKFLYELPQKLKSIEKRVNLQKPFGYENCKTLVLDLDETLVHLSKSQSSRSVRIQVTSELYGFINIRPFAKDLLDYASQYYEVIIFTASNSNYANTVINYLDPLGQRVHHRLYRDHCIIHNKTYIKDLRVLQNRDLKDVIIIDNSILSFVMQIENGVPISTWTEDCKDIQLKLLIDYLEFIKYSNDVRCVNRDIFNLKGLVNC